MAENISQYLHPSDFTLGYSTTNGGQITFINNLRSVNMPERKKGRAAATSVSATNKLMRKRPGWQDPGEPKFTCYRDNSGQYDALLSLFNADTLLYWQLELADGQLHTFTAFIGSITECGAMERDSDELIFDEYTLVSTDDLMVHTPGTGTGNA